VPARNTARDVHQRRGRDEGGRVLHRLPAAVLYRIALSKNGVPGAPSTITLTGEYQHVAGQFNLNGIVATANGKTLIAVQSGSTGATKAIDIGSYDLANGDGLSCRGRRSTSSRTG